MRLFVNFCLILCGIGVCDNSQVSDMDGVHFRNTLNYQIGDRCEDNETGSFGICKLVIHCPYILSRFRETESNHTVCGYEKVQPIVCCLTISERKCNEWKTQRAFHQQVRIPRSIIVLGGTMGKIAGRRNVFGGLRTSKQEFPFMAAVGFWNANRGFDYMCGGTLISKLFVLTAAHCLKSSQLGPAVRVRLGTNNANSGHNYSIAQRIAHPQYIKRLHYNDIGLILLDTEVDLTPSAIPACLPNTVELDGRVTAMGWGATETESSSSHLLKVYLEIFSHPQCNESYGIRRKLNVGIIDATQICAGSRDSNSDTCQGDSGGPLVKENSRHSTVVGVTSIGILCGIPGTPGIYTRVFAYINWIESVVWSDNN